MIFDKKVSYIIFYKHLLFSLLIIILLGCVDSANAQSVDLNKKVTINIDQKPLKTVLKELTAISDVDFSYSYDQIPLEKKITIHQRNKSLKKILNDICSKADINFKIIENQIILKPKHDTEPTEVKKAEVKKYTLSGYLKDKTSGEVLIGAAVYDTSLYIGTTTNAYGFYSLTLPAGIYNLKFSFIGYEPLSFQVKLFQNKWLSADLDLDEKQLVEVVIKAKDEDIVFESEQISQMKLLPQTIQNNPGVVGEVDFIKSLQTIPGIKTYGDGSSSFYVRGGNKDQNMILLDEAPIYNPSHLLGFFSSFSPDAIKDVKIYKGDIPAAYGGRLSSLIDIRTKDGNMNKHSIYGSYGLITGNYTLEGPIWKERCSYFLSLRNSHLDWLYKKDNPNQEINFYDLNAKVNLKASNSNRFYLSFYNGKDFFGEVGTGTGDFGLSWENSALSFRWNHIFSNKLFSNTTVYTSLYDYYLYISKEDNDYWNSYISNFSIKSDFTYYILPENTLKFGLSLNSHYFNPGNIHIGEAESLSDLPRITTREVRETVYYLSNEQKPYDKWSFKIGLRMPVWKNVGNATIYEFNRSYKVVDTLEYDGTDPFHTIVNVEPRFTTSFYASKNDVLQLSYARTTQHLQLLSNSLSPFTSLEVWLPSGPNVKPQIADQFILGYNRQLKKNEYTFSLETYYKLMQNQIDYKDHPKMLLNPLLEGELRFGEAWSYGTEIMFSKNIGLLKGWLSYTISKTWIKTEDINEGEKYPAFYDRPHDFSVYLDYMLTERLSTSLSWVYYTGSTFTSPTGFFYYQGYTVPIYSKRNNDRLPDYHRLDVAANYKLNRKLRKFKHSLSLAVYNVYGRKNPFAINFNKAEFDDSDLKIPANLNTYPNIEPTKIAILGFIPSIRYNFRFN